MPAHKPRSPRGQPIHLVNVTPADNNNSSVSIVTYTKRNGFRRFTFVLNPSRLLRFVCSIRERVSRRKLTMRAHYTMSGWVAESRYYKQHYDDIVIK